MQKFTVYYTEQYATTIEAASADEALQQFTDGDFEKRRFIEGTTELVEGPVPV